MSTSRLGKRSTPKTSITHQGKLDAIRRVHDGESKASVARDIGVPESTLRGWCKNEDKILYMARQSTSPETDDSVEIYSKKPRLDNSNMEPYNLSLKDNTFSREQNSIKNEPQTVKSPLKMNTTVESRSVPDNVREKEKNRAELARMSVNLGLNRPETFMSRSQNPPNLEDLRAGIHMFFWNSFLLNQQKLQQGMVDASTHAVPSSSGGFHAMAPQDKMKHASTSNLLQKHGHTQNNTNVPNTSYQNGTSFPAAFNSFWDWYKQSYSHQQFLTATAEKPILYQQLTKDQQNTENVLVNGENSQISKSVNNNNNRSRTVLDNILINNINNVEVNKKESKEEASHREAIEHGENFLNWLEACSDPTITAVQVMQFKKLLDNVKLGAERKYGDMQNKTKVMRK